MLLWRCQQGKEGVCQMIIKLRVGALMKEQKMTVDQLSKAAHITPNTARALSRGVNERVDFAVIERVAKALGVRPLELFEEVDEERGNSTPALTPAFG